jgi:SSS family solute:Na+ symporter
MLGIGGGHGIYIGFAALTVNLAVTVLLTAVLRRLKVPDGEDRTRPCSYLADEGDPAVRRLDEILDGRPVLEQPPPLYARYPYYRGARRHRRDG